MPPSSQSVITAFQRTFVGPYLDDFALVTSQRYVVHDVVRLTLDPRTVGAPIPGDGILDYRAPRALLER